MTLKRTIRLLLLACGLTATATSASASIVRLHSSATVDKPLIQLGDIAEVFAESEQKGSQLKKITLRTSPIPGNSIRLKLDEIRSRLLKFDVEVGALEFQGSSIVLVARKGQLTDPQIASFRSKLASTPDRTSKTRPFRKTELASHKTTAPRTLTSLKNISTSDMRLAETVIHDLVQDYLSEWASDWGTPIIRPLLSVSTVPRLLSARSGNLKILSGQPLAEDIFLLTVAIPTGEALPAGTTPSSAPPVNPRVETVQVRVRVTRRPKVLAARRVIPQGQVVQEADLEWREVDDIRNGASEPETIVGMEARRTIRQGDFVKQNQVKPPTLIKRNDLVKVAVSFGSIQVTRTLKAHRDGILNDVIELVPLEGSRDDSLLVRVTGKGQAVPLERESNNDKSRIRLAVGEG